MAVGGWSAEGRAGVPDVGHEQKPYNLDLPFNQEFSRD
jgi:hypothetical protein